MLALDCALMQAFASVQFFRERLGYDPLTSWGVLEEILHHIACYVVGGVKYFLRNILALSFDANVASHRQ